MLSRRHFRIKVMQALYAYSLVENNIDVAERNLLLRIEKIYDLYLYLLLTLLNIHDFARRRMEDAKLKYLPSAEEINPNTKFLENQIIKQIESNNFFIAETGKRKISMTDETELFRKLFLQIKDSPEYNAYMESDEHSHNDDKKFIQSILTNYIFDQPDLQSLFEEKNIFWSDDYDVAVMMVMKTISSLNDLSEPTTPLAKIYKQTSTENPDEDKEFVKQLFRKTIINDKLYEEMIMGKTKNWEADRIATIDFLLMKMALCELLEFPTIPVKVTLNEYIDIAKEYSTINSKIFINGILDKIVISLKEENKIKKTGRGLKE